MHRGSPYLSAGFKNNIHRRTHACNQTDFLHQNNCKGKRHWQSPCNQICQVSNEELKLQSFGCQRPLTGGQIYLWWHTIHREQHIVTLVLYLIHSKVFGLSGFFSIAICVFAYVMHTCRPVFLWCHYETGTSKLLTHLLESCFHFSVTPLELPGGSSFLTLYLYLPLLHSSQCLPDNNCDMNHFRQGGAELWWTNSGYKWNTENKFYFNSKCASHFITSNKLCLFVSVCVL